MALEKRTPLLARHGKLLAFVTSLGLAACGADGRYVVIGTNHASTASGTIEVDKLGGDSTQVALHLEFLHAPARVAEGATTYLVWFASPSGSTLRAGALKYNSEQRTGDLTATSPFRHFTVKITAERDARAAKPSDNAIAVQEIQLE
jgi:hypothetical protein